MKTTIVPINDTTPDLLAKGPGRFRFAAQSAGFYIGDASLTAATGFGGSGVNNGDTEFPLLPGEKCFGILPPGSGTAGVVVLEYGTP